MRKTFFSHIHTALLQKRKHSRRSNNSKPQQINCLYESVVNCTKMGALISTSSSSSKANTPAEIKDSSISFPQTDQHISIRTFRRLKARQMSRPTWRKTETSLILEFSKSMDDQLEEVAKMPTTHMPRQSTQDLSHRHSIY
ncbi:C4 [Eupatorium yellow vein virus - [Yamaguchi]]|uniref:C4 protein n=1 Tax=Eupatorium yellow vein virus - [Yamaguchi] TaxID=269095 RepID=Q80IL4_9GEMI|nr:C4 [Eupatorium yellow vein virus - [Yamaguchi]]BAC66137.1 C4 [Eupatorium yellow vein virus - [Yamaguchi]]